MNRWDNTRNDEDRATSLQVIPCDSRRESHVNFACIVFMEDCSTLRQGRTRASQDLVSGRGPGRADPYRPSSHYGRSVNSKLARGNIRHQVTTHTYLRCYRRCFTADVNEPRDELRNHFGEGEIAFLRMCKLQL